MGGGRGSGPVPDVGGLRGPLGALGAGRRGLGRGAVPPPNNALKLTAHSGSAVLMRRSVVLWAAAYRGRSASSRTFVSISTEGLMGMRAVIRVFLFSVLFILSLRLSYAQDSHVDDLLVQLLIKQDENILRSIKAIRFKGQHDTVLYSLQHGEKKVRMGAAFFLGWIQDRSAVMPLITALKDEDFNVRTAAVLALGEIPDPRATMPLLAVIAKDGGLIRRNVMRALAKIPGGQQQLLLALEDVDARIREVASFAL